MTAMAKRAAERESKPSPGGPNSAADFIEPADAGDSKSRPLSNLWMSATAKGSQPRLAALGHSDVGHPEWSPDGKYLAFLSKGNASARSNQVWLLRPDGQRANRGRGNAQLADAGQKLQHEAIDLALQIKLTGLVINAQRTGADD